MATAKASKLSDHWQLNKSLSECNLHMLENNFHDVVFELNYTSGTEQKDTVNVPALQTLLLARSPVFYAMFAGDFAQKKKKETQVIPINDVEPEAFKQMLRFMYADQVDLTPDNVMAVMYVSKKYIVTNLTKKCTRFLADLLSAETAPQLLDQSMLFDEKELKDKVLDKIEEEAPTVLSSEDFTKLSKDALREVLQLNLRITTELEVFQASIKWAQNKCEEMKKSTEGANLREALGENIFLIRFPTMTMDEFNDDVAQYDVLSDKEGYQLFRYITAKSKKPSDLPFSTEPRNRQTRPTASAQPLTDLTPRRLVLPGLYNNTEYFCEGGQTNNHKTTLRCQVSRPMQLRRIMVHCPPSRGSNRHWSCNVQVELSQNGRRLHRYNQPAAATSTAPDMPRHVVVELRDVRVDAGELQLDIEHTVTYTGRLGVSYKMPFSPATASQLSDDYVTITFPPMKENTLLGIEYSPVA